MKLDGKQSNSHSIIKEHGSYRKLKSYHVSQLIYDVTVRFCERYVDSRSRTKDQMVQAARSGVQNIAEGSKASATSKRTEMKLTNVARASLEELRLDYEAYLRHEGLTLWERKDTRRQLLIDMRPKTADDFAQWTRQTKSTVSTMSTLSTMSTKKPTYPEISANGALTLIAVATTLLGRQLDAQARSFEKDGGFTENLYKVRIAKRG